MWFNCRLRHGHVRIFLSCLIGFFWLAFTTLQLQVLKNTELEGGDLTARFHDSVKEQFKTNGKSTAVDSQAIPFRSNFTGNSLSSPLSKERSSASEKILKNVTKVDHGNNNNLPSAKSHQRTNSEAGKSSNTTFAEVTEFTRQEGVAIVTKVHGPHQLALLKQSMCLLHQAYNNKVKYDIVVFTTVPIMENETLLVDIRRMISPVQLTVVVDNDGIVNEIHKLSPLRRQTFLNRCNVSSPEDITWDSECFEDGKKGRISYNWQAEFRSRHIWHHEALRHYRYMLWIDTDAFCTQVWDRDPIAIAMKKQMVIYFENYPQGRAKDAQPRVKEAFGAFLCQARKSQNGALYSSTGEDCKGSVIWTIHGFLHITDLDFFRQKQVIQWADIMIGDCFLCRKWDDQLAVTIPSVMLAPERSWDMYKSGVQLNVFHNNKIDGKRNKKAGGFHKFWRENAQSQFPEALNKCEITEND